MDSPFEVRIAEALEELNGPSKPSLRSIEKKHSISCNTLKRRLYGDISKRTAR
jgi:hypothetical protein